MNQTHTSTRRGLLRSAAGGAAATLGFAAIGTATASAADSRDPVLLVHGFLDTGDTPWWDVTTRYLEEDGYDSDDIHVLSLGDVPGTTFESPSAYGEVVARELESISDDAGGPVDVVGHSMGGLDARWATEQEGADEYVDDLVTLGTPHQGTYAAYLALVTPGGRDMVPGSTLLDELNSDGLAEGIDYTAVWSHADELIVPSEYASLPEYLLRDAQGRSLNSGYQEHVQLAYDRRVFDQYIEYLG